MKVNWKDHIVSTPDVIRGKPRIKEEWGQVYV